MALEKYENHSLLGKVITGTSTVEKELFGGSFLLTIKNEAGESTTGFLHKSHLEGEVKKVKKVKVKELNYFEQYPMFTAMHSEIGKTSSFNDIQVGQIYEGTVDAFIKHPL